MKLTISIEKKNVCVCSSFTQSPLLYNVSKYCYTKFYEDKVRNHKVTTQHQDSYNSMCNI